MSQRITIKRTGITLAILMLFSLTASSQELTAKEIVQRSHDLYLGKSAKSTMTMTIVRPSWTRSITMKNWSLGQEYYITYITAPAADQGQVFLKSENDMWNFLPSVNRTIKIPPSMMTQSWMGSDFTNNDLMRENSMVTDYTQTISGSETIEGFDCYVIKLVPLPEAPVVWSGITMWIDKANFFGLKVEYFDQNEKLIKTETASEIKTLGTRKLPSHLEMIPANKPGHKTILDIVDQEFDVGLQESFFSLQNMRRVGQ